jgi:AcrR family transcriptional regulator
MTSDLTLPEPEGLSLGGSPALEAARAGSSDFSRAKATPASAFYAARRMFLKSRRLDMRELATELGVSRATLYRWTGDREQLLGDVVWSLSDDIFQQAKADHPDHTGAKRILAIFRQHVSAIVQAGPLDAFLRQEPHAAFRILTSRGGAVQGRTVLRLAELLREEQKLGGFVPKADVLTLAYAVVRLTEGFIYNDTLAAIEPEVDSAASIVALLLE